MIKSFAELLKAVEKEPVRKVAVAAAPIVLTSRADSAESKFLSVATAMLMAHISRSTLIKVGKAHY